jgi:competence protein ComEC
VLEDYSVRRVISSPERNDIAAYQAWSDALSEHDIENLPARRGQSIELGDGALLSVLTPGPDAAPDSQPLNDASVVLRLTMGELSFLLTGDITEDGEAALIRTGADLDSNVLKIAHHGSRTSTSDAFLSRTTPLIDVISVAAENPYGHPADDVLARLAGDLILRTDHHGDITLSTDGHRLWLQTDRGAPASVSAH